MTVEPQTEDVLSPGALVGSYEIVELIGAGGMGEVYRARHRAIGRPAAVKVLKAERAHDAKALDLFLKEATTLGALSHRNLVEVLDFGHLPNGQPYLTMAFVDGKTLHETILDSIDTTGSALTVSMALSITEQVLNALGEAHKKGIVHRDLKPANIMLLREHSGELLAKVLDFGLSRPVEGAVLPWVGLTSTKQSSGAGTPAYVSPEGVRNEELDGRADLYSLGCTLFEMLTGQAPFVAESPLEVVKLHLDAEPPRLADFVANVPEEVERLVLWFLQKRREDRPENADVARLEVRRLITKLSKEATAVRAASSLPSLRRLSSDGVPSVEPSADAVAPSLPRSKVEETAKVLPSVKRGSPLVLVAAGGVALAIVAVGAVVLLSQPERKTTVVVDAQPVPLSTPVEAPEGPEVPPLKEVGLPETPSTPAETDGPDELAPLPAGTTAQQPHKTEPRPPKITCTWSESFQSYARREHQSRQQQARNHGAKPDVLDALESAFGDAMVRRDCQAAVRVLDKLARYARSP